MNSNNIGVGYLEADIFSNMAAFDQLPKCVRNALANSNNNWSARQALRILRGKGRDKQMAIDNGIRTARDLAAFIQQRDKEGPIC